MTKQELDVIYERVKQLRTAYRERPTEGVPPSVELLRDQLGKATEEKDIVVLSSLLQNEYSWLGMKQEEEQLTREMTTRFPDEPAPWISLAGFLLYNKGDVDEAKSVIETAITKAHAKGCFIRHAYHTRARIAKARKDYRLLEETLKFLVDFRPTPGSEDINYEDDFLKNLPAAAVNADLVERYTQLCQRTRK